MSLVDTLETIVERETENAEAHGYARGHFIGYFKGSILIGVFAVISHLYIFLPALGRKFWTPLAGNLTQCLTVRPEQACSAYCNSPTILR